MIHVLWSLKYVLTLIGFAIFAMATFLFVERGYAQTVYLPGIWVDPDGCEHWVMDDGAEGYMTPNIRPDGRPVCRGDTSCGIVGSDFFFATNSARLSTEARRSLEAFFQQSQNRGFRIEGHTDSRASDSYNLRLSQARAEAVANVARQTGASVLEVIGRGESSPRSSNDTAQGRAENRRVGIFCVE